MSFGVAPPFRTRKKYLKSRVDRSQVGLLELRHNASEPGCHSLIRQASQHSRTHRSKLLCE